MNTKKQGGRKDRIIEEQRSEIARLKRMVGNLREEIEGYESDMRSMKVHAKVLVYTVLTFFGVVFLYYLYLNIFYL